METTLQDHPHRRRNPLTGEWVLVSPHRTKRPWQGQQEAPQTEQLPLYDPQCYLCPGNQRAVGETNPAYQGVNVFTNDFSALLPQSAATPKSGSDLLQAEPESGICRVICYNPRHDLSMARMSTEQMTPVVQTWMDQYAELGALDSINHVQIFENRGLVMGCSNPHPHGQIWANSTVPDIPQKEGLNQAAHMEEKGSCMLCDYLALEQTRRERLVAENEHFIALVPFWALWPYEMMILPKRHAPSIAELDNDEQKGLADILVQTGVRYDNLFSCSFPYSMGLHQAPTDGRDHPHWHWHIHFFPPLLRSATVKKFMVGYEMMATPQRDLTAEAAASTLRNLPSVHYLDEVRK